MSFPQLIGKEDTHLISVKNDPEDQNIKILEFVPIDLKGKTSLLHKNTTKSPSWMLKLPIQPEESVFHVSLLTTPSLSAQNRMLISLVKTRRNLVKDDQKNSSEQTLFYAGSVIVLKENVDDPLDMFLSIEHELAVADSVNDKMHLHFIMEKNISPNRSLVESGSYENGFASEYSCACEILILILGKRAIKYDFHLKDETVLEKFNEETVARNFWWAQWNKTYQYLAYTHNRTIVQSSFEEVPAGKQKLRPYFAVLQFHQKFPRESVFNMPLDQKDFKISSMTASTSNNCQLLPDPTILTEKSSFKILAHPSGAVYLFQLCATEQELYRINLFHHNKTISAYSAKALQICDKNYLRMDVCLYLNAQYLVVAAWPSFIHFLDVGVTHEPSHHMYFDFNQLILTNPQQKLIGCASPAMFIYEDLSTETLKLESSRLLQLVSHKSQSVETRNAKQISLQLRLALLHYFLIHNSDANAAKRIVYEEGRLAGNLQLKTIYQEFLIAHAYLQTKRQLLPNMETFLTLIPYTPIGTPFGNSETIQGLMGKFLVKQNSMEISKMLLSPRQRIFPHNVTDIWTSLWEVVNSPQKRFCHANIVDKLQLALQCYKPEALSRASTPMSPSSPMICTSLGDMSGLFGRRGIDLQLPFAEHESCTANKQEYIFSINLRELNMHLLKERKDWPLHAHTVAGKYMCGLMDTGRLLCHLACLTADIQPTMRSRDKGFRLIDASSWETRLKLYMLLEHFSLALTTLACPLPQGFTPFFAYLGYKVLNYSQFLWHVRSGVFDLQIDLVKVILADLKSQPNEADEQNVQKRLQLISLLPKSRANRVLNNWSHPTSIMLRARQHASDLLSGVVSQPSSSRSAKYNNTFVGITGNDSTVKKKYTNDTAGDHCKGNNNPLETFFQLLTAKANPTDIDLRLLTEATLLSMKEEKSHC